MRTVALALLLVLAACSDPVAPVPERRADLVCNDCGPWIPVDPPPVLCVVKPNPALGCNPSKRKKIKDRPI